MRAWVGQLPQASASSCGISAPRDDRVVLPQVIPQESRTPILSLLKWGRGYRPANHSSSRNRYGRFRSTSTEQAAVQRAVDRAKERLAEYERANSTVDRKADGTVTVVTKPFPDAGGAVFDELMNSMGAVLGSERNAVFRAFGQEQVETEFVRFGAVQRTITFSANSANPSRPYSLHGVQTTGPNSTSTRAFDFSTLEALQRQAGTVARLLPDDFGKKK